MADPRSSTPSLTDRMRGISAGAPITAIHFIGQQAGFVLGEEALLMAPADGEPRRVATHMGGILSSAADGKRVVTGGDDGRIMATTATGESACLASDAKSRWIDHVAVNADSAIAWSAGKTVFVKTAKGEERSLDLPSSAGGLAFAPKGFRLAISHYNGVSLWFPNAQAKPEFLEWKGVHYAVRFSPDGKFLITTMQEPMLHGWRLADGKHMRMTGYASRVRSLAWTANADYLATGGADQLILWPFTTKDGPMGKEPRLLAPHSTRLAVVAAHPKQPVVAAGFADGMVLLVRVDDAAEILAKRPGDAAVAALSFSDDGRYFAFGCEDGEGGLIDLA